MNQLLNQLFVTFFPEAALKPSVLFTLWLPDSICMCNGLCTVDWWWSQGSTSLGLMQAAISAVGNLMWVQTPGRKIQFLFIIYPCWLNKVLHFESIYWHWRKRKGHQGDVSSCPDYSGIIPIQKVRTLSLLAVPVCSNIKSKSSILQLKPTISGLFYCKHWKLLFSFLCNSLLHTLDSVMSFFSPSFFRLPDLIHTFSLSHPSFPTSDWSHCSILGCPQSNYIFLEVSCPKPGTSPRETCLVLNASKHFTDFAGHASLSATPDHICPLLNSFISWM